MKPFTHIHCSFLLKLKLVCCLLVIFSMPALAQEENAINDGLDLKDPPNVTTTAVYNPQTGMYEIHKKIGDQDYAPTQYMTLEEYMKYDSERALQNYWKEKGGSAQQGGNSGIIPSIYIGNPLFNRIFGGSTIDVRMQGSAELSFGVRHNYRADPMITKRQQRTTNFVFDEKINVNVVAKVGEKIEFKAAYNTEMTFDFDNKLQLKYEGDEDEIIQLIEAGNVNLPLNSTLIKGSQSLFGVKTKLKFGKTTVTAVVSQQESQSQNVQMEGGGQKTEFELRSDDYEENRHFFLSQYFYEHYDEALESLPQIKSKINISKLEVWITNIGAATTENRNIVAFADAGEPMPYNDRIHTNPSHREAFPDNNANDLMSSLEPNMAQIRDINTLSSFLNSSTLNLVAGRDYEKVESARKLQTSEYSYNPTLGFISLNTTLNSNQVLAVAFEYTVIGSDKVYQVGELSDGGIPSTQTLVVKLLRSTAVDPKLPIWKLMMKNVYSLNSYQVNSEDFTLNILFSGTKNGVPTGYFPDTTKTKPYANIPLIEVFRFDRLNAQMDTIPDGIFDFVDNAASNGGTIQSNNGRIYFPVVEPFGPYLRKVFGNDKRAIDTYCYDSLYTTTKTNAQQYPEKNKYIIEGYYKSSHSSEINLNGLNIPEGSVVVTAGGRQLVENVDYVVDYTLGVVRIINEGILNSGTPINVSSENRDDGSLAATKRTFLGVHIDHQVNKDLVLGATFLNMFEKKATQKTNLGDEPVNNIMWGLNADWQQESNMLTKWVNVLPFYSSNTVSRVTLGGEFAHFIPGHSKTIGKSGTSYIDDFEAATTTIDLKTTPISEWFLSSVPQHHNDFPEGNLGITLETGFNRAKMAWYIIDPLFYSTSSRDVPANVTKEELSKHSVRQVLQTEVFPNVELATGEPTNLPVLNIAYYPSDIGPYNYDVEPGAYSAGLDNGVDRDGKLKDPDTRWGGIMREIQTSDFEQTNVEYIELWMMDPFNDNPDHKGGDILFHLGEISEDILRDSRKSFEHGLPESAVILDEVDTTVWGRVPRKQALVSNFSNNDAARPFQDVGYDGLRDEDEQTFFGNPSGPTSPRQKGYNYLGAIERFLGGGSTAYKDAYTDPSHDNFHYFRGGGYDDDDRFASILEKYKNFNGPDGNSSVEQPDGYMIQSTRKPNAEDINNDNTLSENERYYEYKISLRPKDMQVTGENYITDINDAKGVRLANGQTTGIKWYQFKIPVNSPDNVMGNINDFRSMRFMRIVFKGFEEEVVCRLAKFQLVRADWRRYKYALLEAGEYIPTDDEAATNLSISAVNIEENSNRTPVPYVLPPGIDREVNYAAFNQTQRNEQAMVLKVTDLIDGDARAVYKNANFDLTQFKYLKMFVHAEDVDQNNPNNYGDLTAFIRLGSDMTSNYYEYEIPLQFTPWGTSRTNDLEIWPTANNFDIDLEKLVNYKLDRNNAYELRQGEGTTSATVPYVIYEGDRKITIKGTPSISEVRVIMIGVRNPKTTGNGKDDGRSRSAEVWVNELRLTDFVNKQGWAATGRVRIDLADFGNIQFTVLHTSAGFGSIEEKANARSRDNVTTIDFSTNMELGKMTPEQWGVRLPMHFDYSRNQAVPLYSPFDPDVKHRSVIRSIQDEQQRKAYKSSSIDVVDRINLNFMNVRKERTDLQKKPHFWDIENFDFSYAYYYYKAHNVDIEFDNQFKHTGGFGYNYSLKPKEVVPFKNVAAFKSPWLKLLRDFNFYYAPNTLSFRINFLREFQEKKLRDKNSSIGDLLELPTSYYKNFTTNRDYNLRWNLTRGLRFQYQANANTFVREMAGGVTDDRYGTRSEKKEYMNKEFWNWNLGTYEKFDQTVTLSYQVPLDKLPLTDWLSANAEYKGNYNWQANTLALRNTLGNTVQSRSDISLNARANLTTLYNKVGYLKKLNSARTQVRSTTPNAPGRQRDNAQDTTSSKKREGPSVAQKIGDGFLRLLMMVKDVSASYTINSDMLLPGFMKDPGFFGVNNKSGNQNAPGWDVVFGLGPRDTSSMFDYIREAYNKGWLTNDTDFNSAYTIKDGNSFRGQATVEPLRDLRIDVSMSRQKSEVYTAYALYDDERGFLPNQSPRVTGNFSMTTLLIATAFKPTATESPFESSVYSKMKENMVIISERLSRENPNWQHDPSLDTSAYKNGYGATSQDVLLYAFLAAYTGKDVNKININSPFSKFPLPNWRITWKGLNNIGFIKKNFRSVSLNHSYQSNYTISGYQNNLLYESGEGNSHPEARDQIGDYISYLSYGQITLTEQFAPFLGIDMTLKNSLMLRFEYKKSRSLALSFVNNQLTEQGSNEFVFGTGYRIAKMPNIFKTSGNKSETTELNLKLDVGVRSSKTVLRRLDSNIDEMSQGSRVFTCNFSAEYKISKMVTAKIFVDHNQNVAFTSLQYDTSVTNAGLSIRLNLAQ